MAFKKILSLQYKYNFGEDYIFSTKIRVVIYIMITVFFTLFTLNAIFYRMYSGDVKQFVTKQLIDKAEQTNKHIELIIKNIENISDILISNQIIQKRADKINLSKEIDYVTCQEIITFLENMQYTVEGVSAIDLYLKNSTILLTSDSGLYSRVKKEVNVYFNRLNIIEKKLSWTDEYNNYVDFITNRNRNSLTLIRTLKSLTTGASMGVIAISLDKQIINNILNNDITSDAYFENNKIIIGNIKNDYAGTFLKNIELTQFISQNIKNYTSGSEKGYFLYKLNGQDIIFVYIKPSYKDWTFISFTFVDEQMQKVIRIKDYILLFLSLNFILIVILIFLLSKKIFNPVNKLIMFMNIVKSGNFNISITDNRKDEFGYIYKNFNSMVEKIRFLFHELFEEKLLKKDAELKLLQSKINPHFIYNIFDNMNWLIQLKRYDELEYLVEAVAEYYKKSLNTGKDFITVRDTYEQLRNYSEIQKIRFKNRFDCKIDFEQSIMEEVIPNFLLQPLLENAICHGIESKKENSIIVISGKKKDDNLVFTVEDNGIGIPKEKLQTIIYCLENDSGNVDSNGSCFALVNINKRIKLYYGDKYGLEISSRINEGTKVNIVIPIQRSGLEKAL